MSSKDARADLAADDSLPLPPLRTASRPKLRTVGFEANTSPSSVLRAQADSPGPSSSGRAAAEVVESPLSNALRRERSAPQLPQLPKLKLGVRGGKSSAGMPRSKSHGNLRQASAAVPAPPAGSKSATSSPHAASSGGSEPVRIPFEAQRHRRTRSVDFQLAPDAGLEGGGPSAGPGSEADPELSTSVISAASSLLSHHLGAGLAGVPAGGGGGGPGSALGSPSAGNSGAPTRTHSAARDLYLAQADAVTAHAQVNSLQSALRREQEEVLRLREQLQLMTAERDRLLVELQLGGGADAAPVFDMEAASASAGRGGGGRQQQQGGLMPPPPLRPRSALRTVFRLH